MPSFAQNANPGLFLQEGPIIDPGYINSVEQFSPTDLKQMLITIVEAIRKSNIVVNQKDSALYPLQEFVTGQQFFPNPALSSTTTSAPVYRQTFRKEFIIPTLANAGTITVAHGISFTNEVSFTRIYGVANDIGASKEAVPLPFVDVSGTVVAGNIELRLDGTNIYVTTTGDGTNFTKNYVTVEFLKQ